MSFHRRRRPISIASLLVSLLVLVLSWSHVINAMMPAESRHGPISKKSSPICPLSILYDRSRQIWGFNGKLPCNFAMDPNG